MKTNRYSIVGTSNLVINNSNNLKMLLDINAEVAGYINKDNRIVIDQIGNHHSVSFSEGIEKISNTLFHTHPNILTQSYKDSYYFHSEADVFESIRLFFSGDQNELNNLVISSLGIVNLKIESIIKMNLSNDEIINVINEIHDFSYQDFLSIWIKIMGDINQGNFEDILVNIEQHKILSNYNQLFNQKIREILNNYNYLKNINLTIIKELDY